MRPVEIRAARASDARAIAQVHVDAWRTTYRGLVPDEHLAQLSVDEREAMWRGIIPQPEKRLVVAEAKGQVVGFASAGPSRWAGMPFDAELYAMYLLADRQRKGLGTALLRAVATQLLGAGHRGLLAWVLARNPACRFYERVGGQVVGRRDDEVGGIYLEERAYGWSDLRALASLAPERG